MPALRCLIDSMIFDAVAAEAGLASDVDRLTSAGRLELLAAPTSIVQVAATPDPARRRLLQRVRVLVVPPAGARAASREAVLALRRAPGVGYDDALIGAAAAEQDVPLVTEDRALAFAAARLRPPVEVWRWEADLRPRIDALAAELPPMARRRPARTGP
jgi:predicted nucleic acid-binding protein